MYKINFNHLHYFLTIAKEGSIVKASRVLNMTQPALSHQLKLLEEDLQVKLFDRVGKRLVLNENGEFAREKAAKIFRQAEEMLVYLNSEQEETQKIVKIGAAPWLSKQQVYSFIKPALFNPYLQASVFHKDVDTLLEEIESDELDIALCDAPYSDRTKNLDGYFLERDPIVCVASDKKEFRGRFPGCLEDKKVINFSEACLLGDYVDQFLKQNEVNARITGSFSDVALMEVAVKNGGVAAFLPKSVVKAALNAKELTTLGSLKSYQFSLWAVVKKDLNPEGAAFGLLNKALGKA